MVAEQRQNTDAEHRRDKKQEQDVELGVSVWQFVLMEETGEEQRDIRNKFSPSGGYFWKDEEQDGEGTHKTRFENTARSLQQGRD